MKPADEYERALVAHEKRVIAMMETEHTHDAAMNVLWSREGLLASFPVRTEYVCPNCGLVECRGCARDSTEPDRA